MFHLPPKYMFHSISLGTTSQVALSLPIDREIQTHTHHPLISTTQAFSPIPNPQTWRANNKSNHTTSQTPSKKIPANNRSPWHNNSNNRSKNPAASRTPQNRSNTGSPSPAAQQQQQNAPNTQATKPSQPPGNFWAQRATTQSRDSSNGPAPQRQQSPATVAAPATAAAGFNAAEVKAFLARDAPEAGSAAEYKVQEGGGGGGKGNGGGNGGGGGGAKGGNKSEF